MNKNEEVEIDDVIHDSEAFDFNSEGAREIIRNKKHLWEAQARQEERKALAEKVERLKRPVSSKFNTVSKAFNHGVDSAIAAIRGEK